MTSQEAKAYWGTTESQNKEYGPKPPFYATALAHVIARLEPESVVEMGCNAGRNLELLRRTLPATSSLRGFDVNAASIEYGRTKWNLELEHADEAYLSRQPAGSMDVLFTVSVLDHIPAIEGVLADLARVVRRYYLAVEPFPEEDLRYLDVFKRDGRVRPAVTTATPYSYLHPYQRLVPAAGFTARLDVPMPPYAANWGPLYRLTVYEARDATRRFADWDQLRDELMFAAVRAAR
jgi:SAM-dependent methyltransferase